MANTATKKAYSFAIQAARRDKRRQEAEARQRDYNRLSLAEKLERAQSRAGGSKREVERLKAKIAAQKPPQPKTPTKR